MCRQTVNNGVFRSVQTMGKYRRKYASKCRQINKIRLSDCQIQIHTNPNQSLIQAIRVSQTKNPHEIHNNVHFIF